MNGKKARMLRKAVAHETKVTGKMPPKRRVYRKYNELNDVRRVALAEEITRVTEMAVQVVLKSDSDGKLKAVVNDNPPRS